MKKISPEGRHPVYARRLASSARLGFETLEAWE